MIRAAKMCERQQMSAMERDDCPCWDETPDPCPRCGATVSGNDPVRGVCQAGSPYIDRNERLREAMQEACDLLAERTHGNAARSPAHNARLRLEAALHTTERARAVTPKTPAHADRESGKL